MEETPTLSSESAARRANQFLHSTDSPQSTLELAVASGELKESDQQYELLIKARSLDQKLRNIPSLGCPKGQILLRETEVGRPYY